MPEFVYTARTLAGEDVVGTIRAICTEGTSQYHRIFLRSVRVLALSNVALAANNKCQKKGKWGR